MDLQTVFQNAQTFLFFFPVYALLLAFVLQAIRAYGLGKKIKKLENENQKDDEETK